MKRIGLLVTLLLISELLYVGLISRTSSASDAVTIPSRSFQFTYLVHVPALPPGTHQLRVWVPLPYEDRSQGISNLQILAPISHKVERDKEYNDRYAYFVVDTADTRTPLDIRLTFHAQRFEHRVSLVSTSDAPTEPTVATARFLQPDHMVPIDGVISDLSHAQTNGAMQPLEKARKIYEYVVSTMKYDKNGTGWGRGDAIWACDSKRGNCTDFHSVFIGMARATGIPARFEIGFPLPDNSHEGVIPGYHCWAQFFIQGIGWIPVDASEAWKHPEKHDYFFGATDQNRVMFSMGRDIRLKPAQKGDALNYFVYPYAELDGKPYTDLKNEFSFRDDTLPSGPARGIATSD
ncbi:MAG: transglutaminase domain-containing protein [Candidatus Acidiferrales bacterium]